MKTSKHRIQWLDFAKVLIILVVIIYHALLSNGSNDLMSKSFEYVLLIFAMPLFFAISGFLYKPANNWHKYKILLYKKISSFVLPYIIFTFVDIILGMTTNHNPLDDFYRIYSIPVGYLWFLYSLFFIFIIVGLMDLFHLNLLIQVGISIGLMLGQIYLPWQESAKGNINPLAGIGGYMICFYLGYIIKKFDLSSKLKSKRIFGSLSIIWIIIVIISIFITGANYNTDIFNYGDIITKLLSIPIFFSLFVNFNHNRFFKYFDKYGKYTLIIYLVHLPVISTVGKMMNKMSLTNPLLLFIVFVVLGWYVSIFVCYLAERIKWINFVFYPRKHFDNVILKTNWGQKLYNYEDYPDPPINLSIEFHMFLYIYNKYNRIAKYFQKLNNNDINKSEMFNELGSKKFYLLEKYKNIVHRISVKLIRYFMLIIIFYISIIYIIPRIILFAPHHISYFKRFSNWDTYSSSVISVIFAVISILISMKEYHNRNRDTYLNDELKYVVDLLHEGNRIFHSLNLYFNSQNKMNYKERTIWHEKSIPLQTYLNKLLLFKVSISHLQSIVDIKYPVTLSKISNDLEYYAQIINDIFATISVYFEKRNGILDKERMGFIKRQFSTDFSKILDKLNECCSLIRKEQDLKR